MNMKTCLLMLRVFAYCVKAYVVPPTLRSLSPSMRIDYGAGYDPRNRPITIPAEECAHSVKTVPDQLTDKLPRGQSVVHQSVLVLKVVLDHDAHEMQVDLEPVVPPRPRLDYRASGYDPNGRK